MVSIYSFREYRAYLKAFYASRKSEVGGFTFARFSKKAGIQSPNLLKLVMDGGRNLTVSQIHRFAKALELSGAEQEYFEALVFHNQATLAAERHYYSRRLARILSEIGSPRTFTRSRQIIQHWSYPAILVCLYGPQDHDQVQRIEKMTGLRGATIVQALEALFREKLVEKNAEGLYQLAASRLVFRHGPSKEEQRRYLGQQLDRSLQAFRKDYSRGARFYSHTISASAANIAAYENEVQGLLDKLTALSDADTGEQVVQVNVQLFPLIGEKDPRS